MSFNFILSCLAGDYLQAWISPPVHPWMVQIIIHFIFQILKCFMTFLFDINHSLLPLFDKYESFIFLIHVYMLLNTYIVEKINGIAVVWDLSLSDTCFNHCFNLLKSFTWCWRIMNSWWSAIISCHRHCVVLAVSSSSFLHCALLQGHGVVNDLGMTNYMSSSLSLLHRLIVATPHSSSSW